MTAALRFAALLTLLSLFSACNMDKNALAGKYDAASGGEGAPAAMTLELKTDGTGALQTDTDLVPFRWSVKGDVLRLHTREGGVIPGAFSKNVVHISVPGAANTTFKKQQTGL